MAGRRKPARTTRFAPLPTADTLLWAVDDYTGRMGVPASEVTMVVPRPFAPFARNALRYTRPGARVLPLREPTFQFTRLTP